MSVRSFERGIWKINAQAWHKNHFGECHHTCTRVGPRIACMGLLKAGEPNHQLNAKFVIAEREAHREKERQLMENYVCGRGCRKQIWPDICPGCAMPIIGDK